MRRRLIGVGLAALATLACSDDDDGDRGGPDASTGGASTGGASTGGASTGGASTGGATRDASSGGGTRATGGEDGGPSSGGTGGGSGGSGGSGGDGVPEAGPDGARSPPLPDAGPVQITIKNVGSEVLYVLQTDNTPMWLAIEGLTVALPRIWFSCVGEFYPIVGGSNTSQLINPGEQLVMHYDATHWIGGTRPSDGNGCTLQAKAKAGPVSARICANSTPTLVERDPVTQALVQDACTDIVLDLPPAPLVGSITVNLAGPSDRDQ